MTDFERLLSEQMQNRNFQTLIHDNFDFLDSMIDKNKFDESTDNVRRNPNNEVND